ncbi:pyrroline-5-carboxylate reductase [Paenibacillus sp.]|uniref:pyrroline-5-carboxylate reductase n=1 Tax=Paenibacillus sp. TaxID=58172 RepID=UPI002D4F171E|nr:pyrroline-5-carboxylate reductase [Paenibacillus sp.]HZG85298.1 pyrroline-5-carboxylate reductase [Paenibacillus sp.]
MNTSSQSAATSAALSEQRIVFIGAGSMSEALLRGIVEAKLVRPQSVVALYRNDRSRIDALQSAYGIRAPETNAHDERQRLVANADIVVLSVKPKDVGAAMIEFRSAFRPEQLLVSVVAGLSIDTMQRLLGRPQPIVRTMPNTSSTIGLGATGLAFSESVSAAQREMATQLLQAVGTTVPVEENKLNIVTGLSGSGPAYVYYLMEAMIEAGVQGGLSAEESRALAVQTVLGAAHMVETTGEDPAALRAKVTSPNGTTFAAIGVLERFQFREGVVQAIQRAADRAGEMGDDIAASVLQQAKE